MTSSCPKCGAELSPGARFCSVCAFSMMPSPAAFGRRFVAYAVDSVILFVVVAVLFRPFFPAPTQEIRDYVERGPFAGPIPNDIGGPGSLPFFFMTALPIVFYLTGFLYFGLFESSSWMATPGKRLLGIRVADGQGSRLRVTRALARHLARGLSMVTAHLGFLLALFTPERQTLHDLLVGSRVVRAPQDAAEVSFGRVEPRL
jgi:uncharacterized RDD family membrane protein YckC